MAELSQPPTGPRLVDIRAQLDRALVSVRGIDDASLPVAEIEHSLGQALHHVYAALADNDRHVVFREQTQRALEQARGALGSLMTVPSEDAAVQVAMREVAKSVGELQHVGWSMLDGWDLPRADVVRPYLFASREVPRLLELERGVLVPAVPLDEPPIRVEVDDAAEVLPEVPQSLAEVEAMAAAHWARLNAEESAEEPPDEPGAPPPPAPDAATEEERARFGERVEERALFEERARELLEDLGMLGRMRRCTDPEPWASGDTTEARLLTKVDAIAACGVEVFPTLVRELDDRPIPDPELTFANLFFFLSVAGDDAYHQAARLLALAQLDEPGMLEMCVDAFALAPHPRIAGAAHAWTSMPDASRRAHAVEVLRRRRLLTNEHLDRLGSDDDTRVLTSLATGLATLATPAPPGALGWFLQHSEEPVARAALRSALLLRRPVGYERAVALVQEGRGSWADAVMFVAVAGDLSARALIEAELAAGSPAALRAAGWYGDVGFVPFLLGRLEHGDEVSAGAALDALERITGASIVDASLVPTYSKRDEPFVRERREYEPPGLLDGTAEAWSEWWHRWGRRADPKVRYRWGRPYRVDDTLMELAGEEFVQRDRPWACVELTVRGRSTGWPDWEDLVLLQRRTVAHLSATCDGAERWGGGMSA